MKAHYLWMKKKNEMEFEELFVNKLEESFDATLGIK
jgi:hypothetical protein